MPFNSPNYTQMPNELFGDQRTPGAMAGMNEAELKVTLALCRLTFGFHREEVKVSLSILQKITGLSRQAVIDGIEAAVGRGFIERVPTPPKTCSEWRVVKPVDQPAQASLNGRPDSSQDSRPDEAESSLKSRPMKETNSKDTTKETPPLPKNGNGKGTGSSDLELPDAQTQAAILFAGSSDGIRQAEIDIKRANWRLSDDVRLAACYFLAASCLPIPFDKDARKHWVETLDGHVTTFGVDFLRKCYPAAIQGMRGRNLTISSPQSVTSWLMDALGKQRGRAARIETAPDGKKMRVVK